MKHCVAINPQYVNFQNFRRITKAPFINYGNFICVLIPSTNNIHFVPNHKKYHNHIVCSYSYKLMCVDGRYSKSCKSYFVQGSIDKFMINGMIRESEYYSKVIKTTFNKPLVMTEKDHENFHNSAKCCICKKISWEDEVNLKDHDHVAGKYWESAHQECNLNLSLSKKSLLCFIICKIMIHIISFKKLENIILYQFHTKDNRRIYELYYSAT